MRDVLGAIAWIIRTIILLYKKLMHAVIAVFALLSISPAHADIDKSTSYQDSAEYRLTVNTLISLSVGFDMMAKEKGGAGLWAFIKYTVMNPSGSIAAETAYEKTNRTLSATSLARVLYPDVAESSLSKRIQKIEDELPDRYDSYSAYNSKITRLIKRLFPGQTREFYSSTMSQIATAAGVKWLQVDMDEMDSQRFLFEKVLALFRTLL